MKPCTRVGLDVTWQCNWNCLHCFYRHNPSLHINYHVPLGDLLAKVDLAQAGGMDHVVLVGWGEPSLYNRLNDLAHEIVKRGMTWSMITNGTTGLHRFQHMYGELGIDHLHISSHGNLAVVSERSRAAHQQRELKSWLHAEGLPFRTNVTLQQETFRGLFNTVEEDIAFGSRHLVLLGFLPHYEWHGNASTVAVPPDTLRVYVEDAADAILAANRLLTIRYHPLCHLREDLWPYVTNTLHVFFDPWEWNYTLQATDESALWLAAQQMNESVEYHACRGCEAYRHCGGINKRLVQEFGPTCVSRVQVPPQCFTTDEWLSPSGLHDLNPANAEKGYFGA